MHYSPEVTGNAPYTSGLAEALTHQGYAVSVICSHPHYPEWQIQEGFGQWRQRERRNGVSVTRLRHWVPRRPHSAARLVSELSLGIRQLFSRWDRPDALLLVSPALFASAVAMLRARFAKVRTVVWVQDVYSVGVKEIGGAGSVLGALIRKIESSFLRAADEVVVIHESFLRSMVDDLGVDPEKVRVIRNWSHIVEGSATRSADMRTQLGWTADELVAVHAGNQGQKQGLENLVAAARMIASRDLPIRIVLLGGGNQHDKLRKLGRDVDPLHFMPPVEGDTFLDVLRAADVLLVNELVGVAEMSVPSKLTSYFAAGKPIIAACSANGGAAAELSASSGGVRVEPGQPSALVDLLDDMRRNPSAFESFGQNGINYRARALGLDAATDAFKRALFDEDQDETGVTSKTPRS